MITITSIFIAIPFFAVGWLLMDNIRKASTIKQLSADTPKLVETIVKDCKFTFTTYKSHFEFHIKHPKMRFSYDPGIITFDRALREMRSRGYSIPGAKSVNSTAGLNIWFILGMMPTKDKSKINAAYKKMALIYHPDQGGNEGAFRTLTRAKETALSLCDKE